EARRHDARELAEAQHHALLLRVDHRPRVDHAPRDEDADDRDDDAVASAARAIGAARAIVSTTEQPVEEIPHTPGQRVEVRRWLAAIVVPGIARLAAARFIPCHRSGPRNGRPGVRFDESESRRPLRGGRKGQGAIAPYSLES